MALDDFGCGYSSLNHLRHLPIDWVKIDRSFISALESDAGSREVVSALFGLCQAMHLPVVAEGVETEGQREILKALGCRVMQGFLLGGPRRRRKSRLWPRRCHNLGCVQTPTSLASLCPAIPSVPFSPSRISASPTGRPLVALSTAAPGLELDAADIQRELDRRRPGTSRHVTQRQEADQVEILSGVYEGVTTGTPSACSSATPTRAARITQYRRHLPPRPRRLRLLAQVRRARSARRRALVGAADGAHGGGWRHRQEMAGRMPRRACAAT